VGDVLVQLNGTSLRGTDLDGLAACIDTIGPDDGKEFVFERPRAGSSFSSSSLSLAASSPSYAPSPTSPRMPSSASASPPTHQDKNNSNNNGRDSPASDDRAPPGEEPPAENGERGTATAGVDSPSGTPLALDRAALLAEALDLAGDSIPSRSFRRKSIGGSLIGHESSSSDDDDDGEISDTEAIAFGGGGGGGGGTDGEADGSSPLAASAAGAAGASPTDDSDEDSDNEAADSARAVKRGHVVAELVCVHSRVVASE
jgi:hypothetical protein